MGRGTRTMPVKDPPHNGIKPLALASLYTTVIISERAHVSHSTLGNGCCISPRRTHTAFIIPVYYIYSSTPILLCVLIWCMLNYVRYSVQCAVQRSVQCKKVRLRFGQTPSKTPKARKLAGQTNSLKNPPNQHFSKLGGLY